MVVSLYFIMCFGCLNNILNISRSSIWFYQLQDINLQCFWIAGCFFFPLSWIELTSLWGKEKCSIVHYIRWCSPGIWSWNMEASCELRVKWQRSLPEPHPQCKGLTASLCPISFKFRHSQPFDIVTGYCHLKSILRSHAMGLPKRKKRQQTVFMF